MAIRDNRGTLRRIEEERREGRREGKQETKRQRGKELERRSTEGAIDVFVCYCRILIPLRLTVVGRPAGVDV